MDELMRTKKTQVIVIGGKGLAGKSTAARFILEYLNMFKGINAVIEPLAEPLKKNARDFYGWDGKKDERGRRLLQEVGDAGRNYDEDIYCKKLQDKILSSADEGLYNFVLVDDWRYPNEKSFFANNWFYDTTTIRVERQSALSGKVSEHRSENSLPLSEFEQLVYNKDSYYNFEIHNYGTLAEYESKLQGVIEYLTSKIISYQGE